MTQVGAKEAFSARESAPEIIERRGRPPLVAYPSLRQRAGQGQACMGAGAARPEADDSVDEEEDEDEDSASLPVRRPL